MRTRDILISVRLTEDKAENLKAYANCCGLTQSELLRMLMQGRLPQPNPPSTFWGMLNELYGIHDSFRIIADSGVEVSERARDEQKRTVDLILQLQAAVTLPVKVVMPNGSDKDMGD